MTEKRTEKESVNETTTADARITPEPELLSFAPNKFSRIEFPRELRKQISGTKLPRLDPSVLQDTIPPNQAPVAEKTPSTVPLPTEGLVVTPIISVLPRADGRPIDLFETQEYEIEYAEVELPPKAEPNAETIAAREAVTVRLPRASRRPKSEADVRQRRAWVAACFALVAVLVLGALAVFGGHQEPVAVPVEVGEREPSALTTPRDRVAAPRAVLAPVVAAPKPQPSVTTRVTEPATPPKAAPSIDSTHSGAPRPRAQAGGAMQPRVSKPKRPASSSQVASANPGPKSQPPQKSDAPDFEQPFNPQ